jgi:hypothetical protein
MFDFTKYEKVLDDHRVGGSINEIQHLTEMLDNDNVINDLVYQDMFTVMDNLDIYVYLLIIDNVSYLLTCEMWTDKETDYDSNVIRGIKELVL